MSITDDCRNLKDKDNDTISRYKRALERFDSLVERGLVSRREPIETGRGSRAYGGKSCDGLCSGQIGRTFDLSPHIAKGAKRPRPDGTGADDGRADGTGGGKKGGPDPAKAAEGHMANGSWEAWHRTVPRYWAL